MNPLHALIGLVYQFIHAAWGMHHAATNQARLQTLEVWRGVTVPFWATHRIPMEAQRGLADPVLTWLHHQRANSPENVTTVEVAVAFVVRMAMSYPVALPSVYANEDEVRPTWERFGEALLTGQTVLDGLRRLAALTGTSWQWDRRLPWEAAQATSQANREPQPSFPDQTITLPDSPVPPVALAEAAMRDIPGVLADIGYTQEHYGDALPLGERILPYYRLVNELGERHRHCRAAAEWAIHRLVEQGMMRARYGRFYYPSSVGRDGTVAGGGSTEVRDLAQALLETTPELWVWWRSGTAGTRPGNNELSGCPMTMNVLDPADRIHHLHHLAVACANAVLGLGAEAITCFATPRVIA